MFITKRKKILAIVMALTLVLTLIPSNSVHVEAQVNHPEVSVKAVNSSTIKLNYGDNTGTINVTKAKNGIKYVRVLETGKKPIVFKVNTKNETITSKNGTVLKINELVSKGKKAKYVIRKISYAKIKRMLGNTVTIIGVAGVIVLALGAIGFSVPGMIPTLCTLLGGIGGVVVWVMKGSKRHGIKITLKNYMKTITHRGKRYRIEAWKVVSIRKY